MAHWVIVPAAGIGTRMGSITPKQYLPLGGQTVLGQTLHRLASLPGLARIVVALHPEDHFWPELALPAGVSVSVCEGGSQRSQSVLNALQSLQDEAGEDDWVLVHDAVRPCVRVAEIATLLCEIAGHPCGGLLAVPVSSTLKRRDEAGNVAATLPRENVWQAATPQAFRAGRLRHALGPRQCGQHQDYLPRGLAPRGTDTGSTTAGNRSCCRLRAGRRTSCGTNCGSGTAMMPIVLLTACCLENPWCWVV